MITVTVHLNGAEWDKVRDAARTWPGEELSRTELGRRLMILGCSAPALRQIPQEEPGKIAEEFHGEMMQPDSGAMRLQGASKSGKQYFSQAVAGLKYESLDPRCIRRDMAETSAETLTSTMAKTWTPT